MRILYISDALYHYIFGFFELFGPDNIITFPVKARHKWSDIHKCRDEFDLIIISSDALYNDVVLNSTLSVLNWNTSAPIITIDYNALPIINPICYHPRISLYFKREYLLINKIKLNTQYYTWICSRLFHVSSDLFRMPIMRLKDIRYPKFIRLKHALFPFSLKKIRPLPLTIANPIPEKSLLIETKIYDLSFIARIPLGITLTYRNHLFRKLSKYVRRRRVKAYIRPLIGKSYGDTPRLPHSKYMEIIAKSWMSISCRGIGFDTYRFWEILYAGAVLVSEEPKIVIPNNFTDGKNAIFFSSSKELCKKLDYYIGNHDVLKAIARNGREHLLKYHTPVARAKYIINELKNINK
jgi:hypothetical protein